MLIVGERINSSRGRIAEAIETRNAEAIQAEAAAQEKAGADYLDVNAGSFVGEEAEHLKWLVQIVQEAVSIPLCLDSPDPGVIRSVLPLVAQTPMINSVTLEPERLEGILPLAAERGAKLIALCQSEESMAETVADKVEMAVRLVEKAEQVGITPDDLYIDPLVYPLATNPQSAVATLDAVGRIMGEIEGVHTICGLTNVSYGIPHRKLINRTFLVAAMSRGLDSVILDPTDRDLYGALLAGNAVLGRDDFCMAYITAYREGRLGPL
ncbi:MAG: dihydropteroate synthase [Deltaproteobacteria bacterium]|nr:dihydropteroate synthase [Deltaproteobacteria bacterium]MBW1924740.1 dihydropteroate synthase [Deltaproteobacteria bacterium]MBW1950065.1 dihydropteroate synthase [Deltaproteobacteria bacterium]MBW2008501.1 dihydropteroate synthase [Deltaproteobacteria bacterium]MBW2102015.1 dihydropteroate synthase [Deltaproteobacteria bacterium]